MKVAVLGCGPAGAACAIQLAKAGVEVVMVDKQDFPRHTPGETLHPGIEPLLKQLGVWQEVSHTNFIRHEGIISQRGDVESFTPYHEQENWQGFQFPRSQFDKILLDKAIASGCEFVPNATATDIECEADLAKNISVQINHGQKSDKTLTADYFIDATGKRAWLAKKMMTTWKNHGNKRIAYYGYVSPDPTLELSNPKMIWDDQGWTWLARTQNDEISWVRLDLVAHCKRDKNWLPEQVFHCKAHGPRRAEDVTWRIADRVPMHNCFLVGDAAFVLDPASSHGVLKAIMSGMMVAHLLGSLDKTSLTNIQSAYNSWMNEWFSKDKKALTELYADNIRYREVE